jgi:protein-disulfide isomerase
MHKARIFFFILLFAFPAAAGSQTQSSDIEELKKEVQELKRGQQVLQGQLQQILDLLKPRSQPQPPRQTFLDITGQPCEGPSDSKVVLVEFSDYQCPYCARHFQNTSPQIDKAYIQPGKIEFCFMDMPLEPIHKDAFNAALAANCAEEQGKFWPMHDLLFKNRAALAVDNLKLYAADLGLDAGRFSACMENEATAKKIRADMSEAEKIGAQGTPNFWLGLRNEKEPGKVDLIQNLRGAQPFSAFQKAIDSLLEEKK